MPSNSGIFDQSVIRAICAMPERNRYYVRLRSYAGFTQVGLEVERGRRIAGELRVKTSDLIKLACDAIFSFSQIAKVKRDADHFCGVYARDAGN
jgi:polyisoprenyl-phosphate glycosyltransferase